MKRYLAFLLILTFSFACLAACSENAQNTSSESTAESTAESSEESVVHASSAESSVESETDSSADSSDESTDVSEPTEPKPDGFRLSCIDDLTDENGIRTYTVHAPYTDTYTLTGTGTTEITLTCEGEEIASGETELSVDLTENTVYTLTVKTAGASEDFKIATTA
ncbi:MAG: hypothetical protein IJD82_02005, partial [Clostridia bacterium]|nr:hypothetical protein [Clostridia bacterium]